MIFECFQAIPRMYTSLRVKSINIKLILSGFEISSLCESKARNTQEQLNKKEKVVVVDESSREARQRDMHNHGVELEVEFWPVEHPLEPQDEDRPVKCPISAASSVINESRMQEECLRKRAEVVAYTEVNKEGIVMALEPPVRAVRKRHHTLTQDEDHTHTTIKPPMKMPPPLPTPLPTHNNITIFEMLQHFDQFES